MMERRTFLGSVTTAATLFLVLSLAPIEWAWAQQPDRVPVVGLLMSSVSPHDPVLEALRAGLREQGYVEGRNIRLEYRGAQGNLDQLPRLAEELVRLKVDAIVVGNERTARVAKEASASIPIVVSLYNYDPVAGGLIDSFARPGGNLTGIFTRTSELVGKRLDRETKQGRRSNDNSHSCVLCRARPTRDASAQVRVGYEQFVPRLHAGWRLDFLWH